jgi:hypothetical protein
VQRHETAKANAEARIKKTKQDKVLKAAVAGRKGAKRSREVLLRNALASCA